MKKIIILLVLILAIDIGANKLYSKSKVKIKKLPPVMPIIISNGSRKFKKIAITIDDGWVPDNELLDLLKSYKIKCTVFIVGKIARQRPKWIKKMHRMGFEICNHTYSHRWLTSLSNEQIIEELRKGQYYITKITKKVYPYFRPPAKMLNARVLRIIANEGYHVILWDNDVLGYDLKMSFEAQVWYVRNKIQNGNIILSHFGKNVRTAKVFKIIIPEMLKKGYEFVTISELMDDLSRERNLDLARK
jgi:peptidoglycan/xylan/chitin deacetylase (PgdA/CDA1 family)